MRAFAIKNKEGKYLSIASQNYEHYWTTLDFAYYFRFLPNVDAKELADDFKNSRYPDCEVVEVTIAEGDLEKENTMLRKALDLACNITNLNYITGYKPEHFIQQAKEQRDED